MGLDVKSVNTHADSSFLTVRVVGCSRIANYSFIYSILLTSNPYPCNINYYIKFKEDMLNTSERQAVTFFTGYEVEHTPAYGMFTLFVVGTPPLEEILSIANDSQSHVDYSKRIKQIYFGTSQSFNPADESYESYKLWDHVIKGCLEAGYWVTLDYDVKHHEGILESCYCDYPKFVPMISVKLPYINQLNYNTTLKLDDRTWGATNPGVWTHQLHDLMSKNHYTHWDQYSKDTSIK